MITLATLSEATAQEVFNQVTTHLLTQNEVSTKDGRCVYHFNGLKCAAGCLIADDEYALEFEDITWDQLVHIDRRVPTHHANLISNLQRVHDRYNPEEWAAELEEFAKNNNLVFNGPL